MPELFYLLLAFAAGGLATLLFGSKKPAFREQIPGLEPDKAKLPKKVQTKVEVAKEEHEVSLEEVSRKQVVEVKENSTSAKKALDAWKQARGGE